VRSLCAGRPTSSRRASTSQARTSFSLTVTSSDQHAAIEIRQRLYRERRARALADLMARLRATTPVEIVDAAAKSGPPPLPPAAAAEKGGPLPTSAPTP
jgi:predicted Zn-dependent peptidase